jgi:hypothetical protein
MRSMTFQSTDGRSFDIAVEQRAPKNYVEVPYDGKVYRILHPKQILNDYRSSMNVRRSTQNADRQKIVLLEEVLLRMHTQPLVEGQLSPYPERIISPRVRSVGVLEWDGGRRHRGGLGRIPSSAIVDIQADPYSARMLVDTDTAEDILAARE